MSGTLPGHDDRGREKEERRNAGERNREIV
jgi:hypothetical protein